MNLRDLKYITTVADTLNFNRAAEQCFVSQPSLSKQVQKVEEELGVKIFERTNRKVSVTFVGERIVARAKTILQEADAIRLIAKEASDPFSGAFRLGIIPTIAPYLLPRLMPTLRHAFPKLSLSLVEGTTASITDELSRGTLDAVLLALPLEERQFHTEALYHEPFVFAAAPTHPLAKRKRITIEDLNSEKLLLLEDGHCLRAQALEVCRLSGSSESQEFSATSLETLRQMVASGSGATLMPALAAQSKSSKIVYIPFKAPEPSRLVGLVWRSSSPRVKLLKKMSHAIRKEMRDMPSKGLTVIPIQSPR